MKVFKLIFPFTTIGAIILIFFYKTFLYGQIPFPGDLLVSEYQPWKSYSFLGYNPGSIPNKAQYPDTLRQLYPWKTLSIQLLKEGQLPLWNPYNFAGSPLLANFQSAVFYPLNIFYVMFPQHVAWTLLILLQPALAFVFTYFYCQKIGLSKLASSFSGVTFAFSLFFTVWLEYNTIDHVILWLPLVLLSLEHLRDNLKPNWMVILVFALTSSFLAGHPQIFFYLFLFAFCYVLYLKKNVTQSIPLLFLMLLPLGIAAFQLLPGLELISLSSRSPHVPNDLINKILIQPWQLIMAIVPDFFGNPATRNYWLGDTYIGKASSIGLVPLFFIIFLFFQRKQNYVRFFMASGLITLLLTTHNPLTLLLYRLEIPILSTSSPTLMMFVFAFSMAMLAGFGIDAWRNTKLSAHGFILIILPITLFFLCLWVGVLVIPKLGIVSWGVNLIGAKRILLYNTIIVGICSSLLYVARRKSMFMNVILVLLLLFQIFDLWYMFNKFNPFSPLSLIFPNTSIITLLQRNLGINRFWGHGAASIEPNFATQLALQSPEGYDPLYPKRYGEFIQASLNGHVQTKFTNQTRSDARIDPSSSDNFMANPFRLRILDLLGVRFVLDRPENASTTQSFPSDRFALKNKADGWSVMENQKALPRIMLVGNYRTFRSPSEFESILFDKNFDPTTTILLEESLPVDLEKTNNKGEASVLSYTANTISIRTSADTGKLLFLSDVYYPGWLAMIDDAPTRIYRTNYAFRSIYVPKGVHTIRMVYEPSTFKIGTVISLMSIIATIGCISYYSWATKRYEKINHHSA